MDPLTIRMILAMIFWLGIMFGSILVLHMKYGSHGSTIGIGCWIIFIGIILLIYGLFQSDMDLFSALFMPVIMFVIGSSMIYGGYKGLKRAEKCNSNLDITNS